MWGARDGGYFATAWYPAGLLSAGLLLTLAVARPRGGFARSPATLPLALFAAWTAWNAISLLWSDAPGAGREETNKLLTIVVMAAVIAATPWRPRSALVLLCAWAGAVAVIAAVDLTAFALSPRPESWVLEGRYLGPTGYANGSAALGAMAFWPLLALASRPATPEPLRVLALPAAVVAILWALLPQSRGTMLAAGVVVVLFVALAPNRVRVLTRLAIVGGALLLCVPSLFDVYTVAREGRPLAPAVDEAAIRVAVATVLALAASFALVGFEDRVRPSQRAVSLLRRATLVAGVAGRARRDRRRPAASPTRSARAGTRSPPTRRSRTRRPATGSARCSPTSATTTGPSRSTASATTPWWGSAPAASSRCTRPTRRTPSTRATCT